MKKLIAAILLAAAVFSLACCGLADPTKGKEKVFTKEGMSITLTDSFRETEQEGYTICCDSSRIAVFGLREGFDLLEGMENYTLEQYGEAVRSANAQRNPGQLFLENGVTGFEYEYTDEATGVTYRYLTAVYKAGTAFWFMQFSCTAKLYDHYRPVFFEYAKSVTFAD